MVYFQEANGLLFQTSNRHCTYCQYYMLQKSKKMETFHSLQGIFILKKVFQNKL